jgi:hypothetical protein
MTRPGSPALQLAHLTARIAAAARVLHTSVVNRSMRAVAHRLITTFVTSGRPIGNADAATRDTLSMHQATLLVSCPRPFQRREGAFA